MASLRMTVATLGDGQPDRFGTPGHFVCCIRWLVVEYQWCVAAIADIHDHTVDAAQARNSGLHPISPQGHPPTSLHLARRRATEDHLRAGGLPWLAADGVHSGGDVVAVIVLSKGLPTIAPQCAPNDPTAYAQILLQLVERGLTSPSFDGAGDLPRFD